VLVVGKDFADAPLSHDVHGDAIGEAVLLIGSMLIKRQSCKK
jgi:hypothetical protein